MISKSFLKSSIIYTIGGALPMIGSLILLPFYTNYLNDLQFTQITFYISISLLLQILFSYSAESYFGIRYTQLSNHPEQQKKFVGTVSVLLLLIGVGILTITALSGNFIFSHIFNSSYQMSFWPYGFWSVLTAFFNSYFKTSTNSLIYFKKPALFLGVNLINFIATVGISVGGLILFPDSLIGPIYGRLLSGVIIFFLAQYIFMTNGKLVYDKTFLKDLHAFCMPYVFYVICGWVLGQIDRYVLQSYVNNTDLNTYDLMLKCFFGIEFLQNSLSAVIFPKLYEIWNKQDKPETTKESNRYFNVFTAVNITQLILFCIAIPFLYKLFIHNEKFYESEKYIGIIAAGFGLRSILNFYLSTILFTKNIKILLKIFGTSALFQMAVTYFAIKEFGLMGAIYGGLATKVLQIILSAFLTKGIFTYDFNYLKIYGLPFLYLTVSVLSFIFFPGYNILVYTAQLLFFSLLFYFIFSKEIGIVFNQFLGKNKKES